MSIANKNFQILQLLHYKSGKNLNFLASFWAKMLSGKNKINEKKYTLP